jgi:hypothetical protein
MRDRFGQRGKHVGREYGEVAYGQLVDVADRETCMGPANIADHCGTLMHRSVSFRFPVRRGKAKCDYAHYQASSTFVAV